MPISNAVTYTKHHYRYLLNVHSLGSGSDVEVKSVGIVGINSGEIGSGIKGGC
jgi:hypothetical protein